jgi:hypothetical protein
MDGVLCCHEIWKLWKRGGGLKGEERLKGGEREGARMEGGDPNPMVLIENY